MKRIYLVDLENVGYKFLNGSECLGVEDAVFVFYSKTDGVPWSRIRETIRGTGAKVEQIPVYSHAKNALDFQLASFLGCLVGENKNHAEYYIVSKDTGYMSSVEFLRRRFGKDISIEMIRDFCSINQRDQVNDRIKELLGDFPDKVARTAKKAMKETGNLSEYHNYLQRSIWKDADRVYALTKEYAGQVFSPAESAVPAAPRKKIKSRFTKMEDGCIGIYVDDRKLCRDTLAEEDFDAVGKRLYALENRIEDLGDIKETIAERLDEYAAEAGKLSKSGDDYFGIKAETMRLAACTARSCS